MDSFDEQKKQILASLAKTIPENEKTLDFAADGLSRNHGDDVYKEWLRLCFYIAYVDNEIKYMLMACLSNGAAFTYLDKYTALMVHEALETVLVLYGKFFKTVNEAEARDGQKRFDRGVLKAGKKQYEAAIQTVTSDKAFMDDLKRMRNNVAAHTN